MSLRDLTPWNRRDLTRTSDNINPLTHLHQEIDQMFDRLWRGVDFPEVDRAATATLRPEVDVTEGDGDYRVTVELPGVEEKDVEVKLEDDVLTIRGEKKIESERQDKKRNIVERSYGMFERSFRFDADINEAKVQAIFGNGVLTVTLPKSEKAKNTSRKIPIVAK